MCTFYTTLPKHSKSTGTKRKSMVMTLKPCADEKTFYRVRLLAFSPSKESGSDRDYPFITRFVHQHWGVNAEKGYPVLEDEVTCPVTPHVHVEGNRYDSCKICALANKYFINFKESGYKDKDSSKKNKEFGRKYQAIIPVYVRNNPNWEGDNDKFKVIIFNDKKFYTDFCKKVEQASLTNCVFNGKNAVDCCIHVTEREKIVNEGQPNQYVYKMREIDKVVFTTKPYDIPAITKEAVDEMHFDDEYYTTSTPAELDAFYKKYCTISNDDIPMDDDVPVFDSTPSAPSNLENKTSMSKVDIPDDDLNALTSDPDDIKLDDPSEDRPARDDATEDINADALIAELNLD